MNPRPNYFSTASAVCVSVLLLCSVPNVRAQSGTVPQPAGLVRVTVFPLLANLWELTNSFAPVALTNVPVGYCVGNQYYRGWCVDAATPMADEFFFARLYDSLGANLPAYLRAEPWSQINYVLNHKLGEPLNAQEAIWYLQDGTDLVDIDPGPIRDMVAAARQFGPGYVPLAGQIRAIILDPTNAVQRLIMETPCAATNESGAVALAITRSNNAVVISWPSPSTGWTLQQNTNGFATVNWSNVTTIQDNGTTKSIAVNPPSGNRFHRLVKP